MAFTSEDLSLEVRSLVLRIVLRHKINYLYLALALKEIRRQQRSQEPLLKWAPFSRLIKEITHRDLLKGLRYQKVAIEALREAAESTLVSWFEGMN